MDSDTRNARIAGALILVSAIAYGIGSELLVSIVDTPDYLAKIAANTNQALIGMFLELICAVAIVGVAVALFPILRAHSEPIALGYIGFRVIEAVTIIVAEIGVLTLLSLSQEYENAGTPDASYEVLGASLVEGRYWATDMTLIAVSIAYLLLFYMLYQTRLVPRVISALGFVGFLLLLTADFVELFGSNAGVFYRSEFPEILVAVPAGLGELALAIWLTVKGVNYRS